MNLDTLQSVLGWCLLINLSLYYIWLLQMHFVGEWRVRRSPKWAALEPDQIRLETYRLLGTFRMLVALFNFAPWLATMIVNALQSHPE